MAAKFLIVFAAALAMLQFSLAATDYCASSICNVATQTHVACKNNGSYGAACSEDAALVPITDELRAFLLAKHNTLRNNVAKGSVDGFDAASRMAAVQWSPELATIAEYGVKKCRLQRDECRNTADFPYVGQNIARSAWRGTNPIVRNIANKQIDAWFAENASASMTEIKKYGPPAAGGTISSFAQIVQEKVTHVGCAIVRQTVINMSQQLMYCNYAFALVRNRPVYQTAAESGCTTGQHGTYKSLCSFKEVYDVKTL